MDYKMINNDEISIKYYKNYFEKKLKYFIEDVMGDDFFNKISVNYNDGHFNAYLKQNHEMIDLNMLIDYKLTIIPREIFIYLFNKKYIFVDINSNFPEYDTTIDPNIDYDFNYIPKIKKK
jgi:hypothetical protein